MGVDAEMFVRTNEPPDTRNLQRLSFELCAAFGCEKFMVAPPGKYGLGETHHALTIIDKWEQDGPTIHPEPGEALIRCYLYTRYYGPGYERGDIITIIAVAQWLEARIPGGKVWYGGDSSGICAERFGPEERAAMWRHFVQHGHAPYLSNRGMHSDEQRCSFCADAEMWAGRWGQRGTGYICFGCGLHRLVSANGAVTEAYGHYADEERPQ